MNGDAAEKPAARWLLPLLIAAGAGGLAFFVISRDAPQQTPRAELPRPVRIIEAVTTSVIPRALGYGIVRPGSTWQAVAEVSGRIQELHPKLKTGKILSVGDILLRIDPVDHELAIVQAQADILAANAELAELELREKATRASLAIENQSFVVAEREHERKKKLLGKASISRADFDQQERSVLAQQQNVQSLENTLDQIPAQRRLLDARLRRQRTQLQIAELNLSRTTIRAPFDARIAEVNVEKAQYVRNGEVLIVADDIAVAEIAVQVPIGRLRNIVSAPERITFEPTQGNLSDLLGLTARVRLAEADMEWEARFARISPSLDVGTRTVGVIVEVDEPYRRARPGVEPPLVTGMFVEVELFGRERPSRLVIPRSALHGRKVLIANADNRLEEREIKIELWQPEFVVVGAGVSPGERIVVSDPVPAIQGMLLSPIVDSELAQRLIQEATGESP